MTLQRKRVSGLGISGRKNASTKTLTRFFEVGIRNYKGERTRVSGLGSRDFWSKKRVNENVDALF